MECDPQWLRDEITFYCREADPTPGNTVAYDQVCFCDDCSDDIQYTSPVPGLLTTNPIAGSLLDCDTALRLTEFVIVAAEPRRCPGPLQMTIRGY
jgi:hypothetical protein